MRYHPLTILFRIYQLVRNSFVLVLFLFVIKGQSEFWLFEYGRYALIAVIIWRIIYIFSSWFTETYQWDDHSFHLRKNVFVKQTTTIAFSKIQNVTSHTTIFHKLFGYTSITFETAMDGIDDSITFDFVSKQHATFLKELAQNHSKKSTVNDVEEKESTPTPAKEPEQKGVIYFTPSKRELVRASFTSLSFLIIIPIITKLYEYAAQLLPNPEQYNGLFYQLVENKLLLFIIIVAAVLIAVILGLIKTFTRYGKYKISATDTHIFIKKGMMNESHFTIEKSKVQGLEFQQSMMKRIFGLVEVRLISAGKIAEDSVSVNSLYPFLSMQRAYHLVETLLPEYSLEKEMERLPLASLYSKLFRPSWIWLIATACLAYFKPAFLQIQSTWWIVSLLLFILVVVSRVLDYVNTQYTIANDQIQWWHGGFTNQLFVTKKRKVIEICCSQTLLQKIWNVASVSTMNRSSTPRVEVIDDVPLDFLKKLTAWYAAHDTQMNKRA
ncbi:PH domain-containing protein [Gracilibacillus caseinilyticus]|uniref:PH domain-containing protein n=1 Tax=Gracilibacillus caseinilyticus TaxID=2932256 RepID=A0ABY4EZH8_9BACI|nr:PH domain-containing protein [Gracilibacillus caseinilyticus]UOQ49669.1 PH domain-containing protein [Gracilibacillus caseinilyticus]